MRPLELWSQPFHDDGGVYSDLQPLRSTLPLASVLVRETIQNAWDARDPDRAGPVRFILWGGPTGQTSRDGLRLLLGDTDPPSLGSTAEGDARARLSEVLADETACHLIVADRRTTGLNGPTRAGHAVVDGERRFIDFLRNTGRPPLKHVEGGTYGLGKSILWRASRCSTVVVHTATRSPQGQPVSRLMASAWGAPFEQAGRRHTGRHWWGIVDGGLAEPLEGSAADDWAEALGFPPYEPGEFGTTIMVVGVRDDFGLDRGMELLTTALKWQTWPKFVPLPTPDSPNPDEPQMVADIRYDGRTVPGPDPDNDPELRPYAEALHDAIARRSSEARLKSDFVIEAHNPKRELGWLRLRPTVESNDGVVRTVEVESETYGGAPFERPFNHVALIRRGPLLLVGYRDIPLRGDARVAFGGVFLSGEHAEVEGALADSEPPTHDRWLWADLPRGRAKTLAKLTDERVNKALRQFAEEVEPTSGAAASGVAALAGRLAAALVGSGIGPGGLAAKPPAGGQRKTATTRRPAVEVLGVTLSRDPAEFVYRIPVRVSGQAGRALVHAEVNIVLDDGGGVENAPDLVEVTVEGHDSTTVGVDLPAEIVVWARSKVPLRLRPAIRAAYEVAIDA